MRARLRELASQRGRFGYWRLHLLLEREGVHINWKKLYRLYGEERLTVRKRGGRKRALGIRAPMSIPQEPNQRWSLDFVSDAIQDGRRFRVLCVIDEPKVRASDFSRECLATALDNSLSGEWVVREFNRIAEARGYPLIVVSDNGTELTSNAILKWQEDHVVEWHYIAPGKPMRDTSLSRASTAGSGTNASTSTPSPAMPTREISLKNGGTTSTRTDHAPA